MIKNSSNIFTAGNCPYFEFLWFVFSRDLTEYEDLHCKLQHSAGMRKNTDQKNSECGLFYALIKEMNGDGWNEMNEINDWTKIIDRHWRQLTEREKLVEKLLVTRDL